MKRLKTIEIDYSYNTLSENSTPKQVIEMLKDFEAFAELFETRSLEYGDGSAFALGSRGQFSDIYRKIIKLKTGMWDGKEEQLTSEGVDEILLDLIGHCFLSLQARRREGAVAAPNRDAKLDRKVEILLNGKPAREAFSVEGGMIKLPTLGETLGRVMDGYEPYQPWSSTEDPIVGNLSGGPSIIASGDHISVGDKVRLREGTLARRVVAIRPHDGRIWVEGLQESVHQSLLEKA